MSEEFPAALGPPPHVRALMGQVFGKENMQALELAQHLRIVVQLMRNLSGENARSGPLSPARMRLLVHLLIASEHGCDALAPSSLSQHMGVSRNTISALLNGLEEQGYIVRELHLEDRRQFRVQITPAGAALVREYAPRHGALINSMLEPLSVEERAQMIEMTGRLIEHLAARAAALGLHSPEFDPDLTAGQPSKE
ncbi:MAG: MarR family transcriptional regulator [Chloroflexota bacterium]|nr:MarR family transcriptional regulator [Anaerolineae bacterium]